MKYGKKIAAWIITGMLFSGCGTAQNPVSTGKQPETGTVAPVPDVKNEWTEPEGELQEDVYAGYADNAPADFSKVKISCLEGIEGNTITISGGEVHVYCTGDGIDSNSRTPEEGIIFSGGDTLVISDSGMNSAIDTEQGYRYEGGRVVAVMPNGGMSREAMDCRNFSAIGSKQNVNLSSGKHVGTNREK